MKHVIVAALAASLSSAVLAGSSSVAMDGQLDASYGAPLAIQDTQTQFGDSNLGLINWANGSELDVAHGFIDTVTNHLRIFLGGNLESNFNKLDIFIDYRSGAGQNKLRGDNPNVDFNGLNRLGDDGSGNGLTFDEGFDADYFVTLTCGNDPLSTFANTSQVLSSGGGTGQYIGSGGAGRSYLAGSDGTLIAINNSNIAGVNGGTGLASGAGVTTGIEIAIPLANLIKYGNEDIKVCAFINAGGHDFVSNQVLAGIGGGGNLGEPRFVNFSVVPGNQYFVVPAPILGDLNSDGEVGGADLAILLGAWGPCSGIKKGGCSADLNGDGNVDGADLAILLGAWG
jgi:hypothetical protein